MGTISTYIEGIASSLTTTNTYLEGNQFDFNLDVDAVTTFPVIYFFNLLSKKVSLQQSGSLKWYEFDLVVTFGEKNEQDMQPSQYAAHIETMEQLANDFMVKIRLSDEWKNVYSETELPIYNLEPFIDSTDTGLIGVILSTTIKLKLTGYDCTGL